MFYLSEGDLKNKCTICVTNTIPSFQLVEDVSKLLGGVLGSL